MSLPPSKNLSLAEPLGSCKGQQGKPKPREETQSCHVAKLLKRCPVAQWLRGTPLPAQQSEELSAIHPWLQQPRRLHHPLWGKLSLGAKPTSSNKSLLLAGREAPKPTSPWHKVIPLAGRQLTSASPTRGEPGSHAGAGAQHWPQLRGRHQHRLCTGEPSGQDQLCLAHVALPAPSC